MMKKLQKIILDITGQEIKLTRGFKLKELSEWGIDSLDMAEIVMYIEECFDIEIPEDELCQCITVQNVTTLIRRNLKQGVSNAIG